MSTGVARSGKSKVGTIVVREKSTGKVIDQLDMTAPASVLVSAPRFVGLGDLVATFAKPIAGVIDTITDRLLSAEHRTALSSCGACARRHRKLNLLCPDLLTCSVLGELLRLLPGPVAKVLMEAVEKRVVGPG